MCAGRDAVVWLVRSSPCGVVIASKNIPSAEVEGERIVGLSACTARNSIINILVVERNLVRCGPALHLR